MSKPGKRNVLGTNETKLIIEIWKENIAQLRGVYRNVHVYSNMCKEAEKCGIFLSTAEMRTRINNLTKRYRAERIMQDKDGGTPSVWALFNEVHSVLGQFKSIKNNDVDESSEVESIPTHKMEDYLDLTLVEGSDDVGTQASLHSSESVVKSPSPLSAAAPSPPVRTPRKRKASSGLLEIMQKDQALLEHFLKKTLENDQKVIELLQENNKLLSDFLKK